MRFQSIQGLRRVDFYLRSKEVVFSTKTLVTQAKKGNIDMC